MITNGRPAPTQFGYAGSLGAEVFIDVDFKTKTGVAKMKAPRLGVNIDMDLDCTVEF